MIIQRMAGNCMQINTVNEKWHRAEAALAILPVHTIHIAYDLMTNRKISVIFMSVVGSAY